MPGLWAEGVQGQMDGAGRAVTNLHESLPGISHLEGTLGLFDFEAAKVSLLWGLGSRSIQKFKCS